MLCSDDRLSGLFISLFFNNGRKLAAVCARLGIYRVKWCIDPIKLFSCLKLLGGDSFLIASVFFISGLVPSLLMLKPNH